jgi:hypothetical protein
LAEQEILDAQQRRHHAEQILRSHHPVEQVGDRHPHRMRSAEVDVERIEIEHEDAVVGIPGELEAIPLRIRVAPLRQRRPFLVLDELEAIDGLRLTVLEHDEVVDGQAGDGFPVPGRIGVHPHEVSAAPEGRGPLRIGFLFLRLLRQHGERRGRNQGRRCGRRYARHRTSGGVLAADTIYRLGVNDFDCVASGFSRKDVTAAERPSFPAPPAAFRLKPEATATIP